MFYFLIYNILSNFSRGANAGETTVRILSTLCEAVMWMLRDWPNEDPVSSFVLILLIPDLFSLHIFNLYCYFQMQPCSSSFTESRMKSLAKLRKLLETERPAKNTSTDALFLMLADSVLMMAGQWPPQIGGVNSVISVYLTIRFPCFSHSL